jgi:hypothetical protein
MLAALTGIFGIAGALRGMTKSPKVSAAAVAAMRADSVSPPKGSSLVFDEQISSFQVDSARQAFNAPPARADVH